MTTFAIGAATVTRIEETYELNFEAAKFFPDWRSEVVEQHRAWMLPHHYDALSGSLKLSVHSWLVRVGGRTILIACVGNGKARPTMPNWHSSAPRFTIGRTAPRRRRAVPALRGRIPGWPRCAQRS